MLLAFFKFYKKNSGFFLLLLILLVLLPIPSITDSLALKFSSNYFYSQPWRMISAHFVHSGWMHLVLNITNIVLLRLAFREWITTLRLFSFILFSALIISLGLKCSTELDSYIGFSGIIHGLLVYLLLTHWRRMPIIFSLILVFVVGKVISEQFIGGNLILSSMIRAEVAVESHAWGVISAFGIGLIENIYKHLTKKFI